MKRQTLALLVVLGLVAPGIAVAQPDGPFGADAWRDSDRPTRSTERRLEAIAEYLELSEAQAYEWETMAAARHQTRRTAWDDVRSGHEALREMLESGPVDASLVGQTVIDLHAQQQALRDAHEADIEAFKQILTPDQEERFDALMAARALGPRHGERRPHGRFSRRFPTQDTESPAEGN